VEYYHTLQLKLNGARDAKDWWDIAKEFTNSSFVIGTAVSAEDFKQYFQKLLNPEVSPCLYHYAKPFVEEPMLDRDFEVAEIVSALQLLKDRKAPGEDRVPYEFYKYAPTSFHQTLSDVFSRMLYTGKVDESFYKSVIFPIHKKGDLNDPSKYRGITFMNCGPKLFMAILNRRLTTWVESNNKLKEFQAGFRAKHSTVDNIYALSCIVHLKFHQNKKVYAFFVDFQAAFDRVPRQALFYKLSRIGVSTKFLQILSAIYDCTLSTVWNGDRMSDYFQTNSGVKQGCLISPLLFALFLDDLHDELGGGLNMDGLKIRVLLYADDIVILADEPTVPQRMISKLEKYCENWNLIVNLEKSKIMVFRKGGKLRREEAWKYRNMLVEVTNKYSYLGVELTPKMRYTEHIERRTKMAKTSIYGVWGKLLNNQDITLQVKIAIFTSAIRSIQCYASQVFGYGYHDIINKMQIFFLKYILRIPSFAPTYAIYIETKEIPSSVYSLRLHMKYIFKTLFAYEETRLPHILSKQILSKKIYWFKEWRNMEELTMVRWDMVPLNEERWKNCIASATENYRVYHYNMCLSKQRQSINRFYKYLSQDVNYINIRLKASSIRDIIRARCDMLNLKGNQFGNEDIICTLCNRNVIENIYHVIGECPRYEELRLNVFSKSYLEQQQVTSFLNGEECEWKAVADFVKKVLDIRRIESNQ
jgi:hypothetical protein